MPERKSVGFGGIPGNFDHASAYGFSFGPLADKTPYYDPHAVADLMPQLKAALDIGLQKFNLKAYGVSSATGGGAGTAGIGMVPVYVDPRIVDITRKYTPWIAAIRRVTNLGLTADYNRITAKGGAVFAAPDAPAVEQDDTYERQSVGIKYLYAWGRVLGPAQASYPAYILDGFRPSGTGLVGSTFGPVPAPNAKQLNLVVRAQALREAEEDAVWNGDTDDDANEFNGIVDQQSTTNKTDKNTSAIDYGDVEDAIQDAFDDGGRPALAGAASSVLKDLRKIMIDTYRFRPDDMKASLPFGVTSNLVLETMIGPVPVVPSMFLSNTSGSKAIYFLDMTQIEMRVLQDVTFQDLANTNDSDKFMLKLYEALVLKAPTFNSWIGEIL